MKSIHLPFARLHHVSDPLADDVAMAKNAVISVEGDARSEIEKKRAIIRLALIDALYENVITLCPRYGLARVTTDEAFSNLEMYRWQLILNEGIVATLSAVQLPLICAIYMDVRHA